MSRKDLRLEYSGYVIFAAKIVSVATGLGFQFIVARALSKAEYDLYFNALTDVAGIFALLAGVLPFWAMRFATRDARATSRPKADCVNSARDPGR